MNAPSYGGSIVPDLSVVMAMASATHRMYRRLSPSYHTRAMHSCVLHRHCRLGYTHGMFFKFDSMSVRVTRFE